MLYIYPAFRFYAPSYELADDMPRARLLESNRKKQVSWLTDRKNRRAHISLMGQIYERHLRRLVLLVLNKEEPAVLSWLKAAKSVGTMACSLIFVSIALRIIIPLLELRIAYNS